MAHRDPFGVSAATRAARRLVRQRLRWLVWERFRLPNGLICTAGQYSRPDWLNIQRRWFWAEAVTLAAEARRVRTPWQARRLLWQAAVFRVSGQMAALPDEGASHAAS